MADISPRRQREIDEMLDQLNSLDAAERRAAAYWLGEAAAADAVPALVDAYENDENRSVRKAAAYALGMFRAVDVEIKKGKERRVVRLLEQVETKGRLGSRADKGRWIRLILGLLISLVVLTLTYQFLPTDIVRDLQAALARAGVYKVEPATERDVLLNDLRQNFTMVRDNISTLQGEFQSVLGGGGFDCSAYFNDVSRFEMAGADAVAYPEIAQIVPRLNAAHDSFQAAYARHEAACNQAQPLPAEEAGSVYATLVTAIQALPEIEAAISAAERSEEVVLPQIQATSVPNEAPTDEVPTNEAPTSVPAMSIPTTEAQPTSEISIANPRMHLTALYGIIDSMTGQRGATTLLVQYWDDVQRTGRTGACGSPPPTIPEHYTLPPADAQASPELAQAVESINTALDLTRSGWTDFVFACNSGELSQRVAQELPEARQAAASFQAAEQTLNRVRDDI